MFAHFILAFFAAPVSARAVVEVDAKGGYGNQLFEFASCRALDRPRPRRVADCHESCCFRKNYKAPNEHRRSLREAQRPRVGAALERQDRPGQSRRRHEVHGEAGPGSVPRRLHIGAPGHGRARRGAQFLEGDCFNNEPRPAPRPRPGAENIFRADVPGEALGRGVGAVRRTRFDAGLRGAPRAAAVRREALGVVPAGRVRGISFETTTAPSPRHRRDVVPVTVTARWRGA